MNIDLFLLAGLVTVSVLRVLVVRAVNNEIDWDRAIGQQLQMRQRRQASFRPSPRHSGSHLRARQALVGRHS